MMGRCIYLILFVVALAGCGVSSPTGAGEKMGITLVPTNTFVPSATPSPAPQMAATETPISASGCAWVWAEKALPDLAEQLTRAMRQAGLDKIEVTAYAFGENCVNDADGSVERFAAMQTDFRLMIPVEKLEDKQELGGWVERALPVIEAIPADQLPGPNPGQVQIRFTSGEKEINLQFSRARANALMEEGITGSALYDALHVP